LIDNNSKLFLFKADLAEKLLEHFLIPGTVPSLPSDSAQTLEEDYQDSQINPDKFFSQI
jgi:hypothetical protein